MESSDTELGAALAAVGALAADSGDDTQLAERVRALWAIRCIAEAALTASIGRFHTTGGCRADGAASTVAWLRGFLHMAPELAARFVKVGTQLDNLPAVTKALITGEISTEHAAPIAALAHRVGADALAAGDGEQILLDLARRDTPQSVRAAAKHLHTRLTNGGDGPDDARHAHRSRYLNVARTFGGAVSIDGLLDPVGGEAVIAAVNAATPAPVAGDNRTAEQRRADGLVDLCGTALAALPEVAGERPRVTIILSYEELVAACRTAPGVRTTEPLDAATVRMMACDAGIIPMVLGSDSMPLDVGRATRAIPSAIRRALTVRDRGCRFAGCDRPAHWCDGHHLTHWVNGGETKLANLVLLCRHHHGLIHDGWQLHRQPDGDMITLRPDGSPLPGKTRGRSP